jgi:hypothetical protein
MRSLLRAARTRESVDEGALHARLDAGHRQDREPVGSTDVAGDAAGISGDGDHSPTKTKSPQTNGIGERFHKTLLDEFYRVVFRKKIYGSIAEPQKISIPGSKATTRKGLTRGDGSSARRRCKPSLTRCRLRRRK